ncbi:MAG: ATP-binding protein, partial [Gammaproteobacteria bacterium]
MVIRTSIATLSCDKGMLMGIVNISGSTEITAEGIRKHFKTTEPHQAVIELVWNGFDAKASTVVVALEKNDLGGLVGLSVLDDGDGIDFDRIGTNFGRFNESAKRDDFAQHGSHGRGRMAFHKLAHRATWYTKTLQGEAVISISGNDIKLYDAQILEADNYHNRIDAGGSGTLVELDQAHGNLPDHAEMLELLSKEFGWFLALNPTKQLLLDGDAVSVPSHELHEEVCHVGGAEFRVKVIRWEDKPSSEKSYVYLLGSSGHPVYRQLSSLNNKPNFFTSVYVQSPWADNFEAEATLFSAGTNTRESEAWRGVAKQVVTITRKVYDEFLRRFVERQIERFEKEGVFPTYAGLSPEYATWRLENAKNLVRSIYTADPTVFNSLKRKQRKILVGLLDRLSVSNENDALFDVLNS